MRNIERASHPMIASHIRNKTRSIQGKEKDDANRRMILHALIDKPHNLIHRIIDIKVQKSEASFAHRLKGNSILIVQHLFEVDDESSIKGLTLILDGKKSCY